jgi:hypothetical protein
MGLDMGSGKTYPGSWIQGSKLHRIQDPQHCFIASLPQDRYSRLCFGKDRYLKPNSRLCFGKQCTVPYGTL